MSAALYVSGDVNCLKKEGGRLATWYDSISEGSSREEGREKQEGE